MIVFSRENRIDRCIAAYWKSNAVVTLHGVLRRKALITCALD
jgi:hypothetical protein